MAAPPAALRPGQVSKCLVACRNLHQGRDLAALVGPAQQLKEEVDDFLLHRVEVSELPEVPEVALSLMDRQILGRNLEALVGRAQELKEEMKDDFVSVEHLLLAYLDDTRFGADVLAAEALDKAKIQAAVKQVGARPDVVGPISPLVMIGSSVAACAQPCYPVLQCPAETL